LIEKKFGRPIAKEVELKNPEENLGAQMVREAAERSLMMSSFITFRLKRLRALSRLSPSFK
jgi:hypothetical protein